MRSNQNYSFINYKLAPDIARITSGVNDYLVFFFFFFLMLTICMDAMDAVTTVATALVACHVTNLDICDNLLNLRLCVLHVV